MDDAALHQALLDPEAYPTASTVGGMGPGRTNEVGFLETHVSRLYFVGPRVFKVKKAVAFPFLDFSTLERRRVACEEEVRLNRRLAAGIYHGVVPIRGDAGGGVRVGGTPGPAAEVIEYAVEMDRLPADGMLDQRLARGEIDRTVTELLATRLAEFHRTADHGSEVAAHAMPAALAQACRRNLDESLAAVRALAARDPSAARCLPAPLALLLRTWFDRFLVEEEPLLARRVAQQRIVEGHGDLHAGNVCLTERGPVIYDCIEFSRPLRCVDPAADLAFLLMDIDRSGFRAFATDLARRYAQITEDPDLARLLPFYKAQRACIRGKVAALRAAEIDDRGARAPHVRDSAAWFAFAALYALPPLLVATCGLPGSGKSHVARAMRGILGAVHLQSDLLRKQLAGVSLFAHARGAEAAALYSPEMTQRTYDRLLAEADDHLREGGAVLVDATFPEPGVRAQALATARLARSPFIVLYCVADEAETRRRLAARATAKGEISDADVGVYEEARKRFVPPEELPAEVVVPVAPDADPDDLLATVVGQAVLQLDGARTAAANRRNP